MNAAHLPLVSVVVPTYRRPDLLASCLFSLLQQDLSDHDFEVLVCDDGPSDAVQEVVQQALQSSSRAVAVHYLPVRETQGPAGARNVGWQHARAPIIAFTDDDTLPSTGWLRAGLSAMHDDVAAVTGRLEMPLPERFSDYERDAARLQEAEFITANCFVRRSALESVGGFDTRYTQAWREDSDLHFALLESGYRVQRAPDAVVIHPLRSAPFAAGMAAQRKVMFDVLLYGKYPRLYRERIRQGPPWFYLLITASLVMALVAALFGISWLALLGLAVWIGLTFLFFWRRLALSFVTARNVAELALTSIVIPPLSVFWRLVGAVRFGWRLP